MHQTEMPRRFREPVAGSGILLWGAMILSCSSGPVSVGDNRESVAETECGVDAASDLGLSDEAGARTPGGHSSTTLRPGSTWGAWWRSFTGARCTLRSSATRGT